MGAKLILPEFLQKRTAFSLPQNKGKDRTWLRVRDEGNKITLTLKTINGSKIINQKEV